MFATQAAVVLTNAQAYWGARLKRKRLQVALDGRQLDRSGQGFIMNGRGCGPDEAFDLLVKRYQQENRKLPDVAVEIVPRVQRPRQREPRR